jgi:hypothetical protein
MTSSHTRIIQIPEPETIQGGRLDSLRVERVAKRVDLLMDFQGFLPSKPSLMLMEQGILYERLEGHFVPRRLRFTGVSELKQTGLYQNLDALPPLHEARAIRDILTFRPAGQRGVFVIVINSAPDDTDLEFLTRKIVAEPRKGRREPIQFARDWSAAPSMPARLAPDTRSLYRQFGGDPIAIRVNGKIQKRRLFIGGLDKQNETRPNVDAVLNLSESPSRWLTAGASDPRDRWEHKGEGRNGMSLEEITTEAMWVIDRINAGQRVLVHCVAGMNRSPTICCAALILQEKLTAEQALARVRERHPWARPDSLHWLKLRWLASAIKK